MAREFAGHFLSGLPKIVSPLERHICYNTFPCLE
ncbi:hypothetical protein GALL_44590 [mine drainage metagenome]|uniref:Uncharacterized protein n=1 Tax=mine drainage metagenome TaxID=410659 RepID=A0A1J5TE96_9ZZZZ